MSIDFGRTASDYAQHRAGFPDRFFDRVMADGTVSAGDRLVDLGTGTGTVARGFAMRGCRVTGLDPSDALRAEAEALDRAAGVSVRHAAGTAEATGLEADQAVEVHRSMYKGNLDDANICYASGREMLLSGYAQEGCQALQRAAELDSSLAHNAHALIDEHRRAWQSFDDEYSVESRRTA